MRKALAFEWNSRRSEWKIIFTVLSWELREAIRLEIKQLLADIENRNEHWNTLDKGFKPLLPADAASVAGDSHADAYDLSEVDYHEIRN